jgi:hypothetical protein
VHHDGTRRADRKVGKHGELMQFVASYFHPGKGHAVSFILSMRFTVGGSAAHTARALAVALSDMGIYRISPSPNPRESAFHLSILQSAVLCSVGSDNTGSATNVENELFKLTGETLKGGTWPCPTHINALEGSTPTQALCGYNGTAFERRTR